MVYELMKLKKKRKITLSFTSPGKDFFFNLYEVFTSPEKGKRPTIHYLCVCARAYVGVDVHARRAVDNGDEHFAHQRSASGILPFHLSPRTGECGPLRLQDGGIQRTCVRVFVRLVRHGLPALCIVGLHLLVPLCESKKFCLQRYQVEGEMPATRLLVLVSWVRDC